MDSIKYNFNGKDDIWVFLSTRDKIRCGKEFAKQLFKDDYGLNEEQLHMIDDYDFIVDGLLNVYWNEYKKFARDYFEDEAMEIYEGLEK